MVTFKRHKKEGFYRSFQRTHVDIKRKRKIVGKISETKSFEFTISLIVRGDGSNPNCEWRWLTLKGSHPTEEAAREFIKRRWTDIETKFDIMEIEG